MFLGEKSAPKKNGENTKKHYMLLNEWTPTQVNQDLYIIDIKTMKIARENKIGRVNEDVLEKLIKVQSSRCLLGHMSPKKHKELQHVSSKGK